MDDATGVATSMVETGSIAGNAIGDQPTPVDSLGFTPYVEAIARFLTSDATRPPITISIEGDWGSGKSSFLLQLERAICGERVNIPWSQRLPQWLGGQEGPKQPTRKRELSVRFNAWRHDKQDELWAAFALAFVKSLRAEVGLARAWRGDVKLFLSRLKGGRGWLELGLLVASLAGLAFGVFELWSISKANPAEVKHLLDWLLKADVKPPAGAKTAAEVPAATAIRLLAKSGTFGTMASLGAAGLLKFHSYLKMPLSLKLEKYIAKPDYEGHSAFIESFHLDLNRLIEAYAGERRVFIFIDDLDRCDVPRAADLMQAINLMIGDSKNLVFIIGMDREKVAAGITQKYKDILPFLRDSAHWKPNDKDDNYTPLYFGYGYLEKFIQISFSLPVSSSEAALASFFRDDPAPAPGPPWWRCLYGYWVSRFDAFAAGARSRGGEPDDDAPDVPPPQSQQTERIYNRLKLEQDSERIRNIVRIVSGVFEHNPRRIKQFINTFRLALYIASDQGLFDEDVGQSPAATPEQIGKFVALLLRFPDLRFDLEQDLTLLGKLQDAALKPRTLREVNYHWLLKPGTVPLLVEGYEAGSWSGAYSLANFDVSRFFSVLPRAVRPPDEVDQAMSVFDGLATRYEAIRAGERGGPGRTRKMTALAAEAREQAASLKTPATTIALLGTDNRPGRRLMRIIVARVHQDTANLGWLMDYSRTFLSPFEHFWCLQALIALVPDMSAADRRRVAADLEERWLEISSDPGRVRYARELRDLVDPTRSTRPPRAFADDAAAPSASNWAPTRSVYTPSAGIDALSAPLSATVSIAKAPAPKRPAPKRPAPKKPAPRKPAAKKPAPRKPAAKKPAPRKPAAKKK
jgi:hypothetical protein